MQILSQQVRGEARAAAFLTDSQVVPLPRIPGRGSKQLLPLVLTPACTFESPWEHFRNTDV